jgi:hypothetical protein
MTSNIGGDITNISGLQHILSIGYEVECGILMKLTKSVTGDSVLFNSDTARKDIMEFQKFEENPEDIDEDIIDRLEEMVEDNMYDDNGNIDKDTVFQITNDIAMSPFIKKLDSVCHYPSEEIIKSHTVTDGNDNDYSNEKNELYVFRDNKGKDYNIHFLFGNKNLDCATHSNVEWVFTYFKPKRSNNIIINTFLNMIKNLLRHLSDLKAIKGEFIMKYKDENGEDEELIIAKPEQRTLYHKPNTNLYYLLTQVQEKQFTIDDACSVFQMTFSSKGENVMAVMIALMTDTLNSIASFNTNISSKLVILINLKMCVDELVDSYNKTDTKYKFVADRKQNQTRIDIIKNYLCLILLKITRYYEFKNSARPIKYLKNLLFFNSRHSNYVLYMALKKKVEKLFNVKSSTAVNIIKKLLFQPDILKKMFSADIKLRRGVLSMSNTLDKTNKNYGDPTYSLVSYFDFFEEPSDNESNIGVVSGKILNYDWLEYKQIDDLSTKMDLKNDIVLVECRVFQKLLSTYIYSIADTELKNQMKHGSCNILTNHYEEDVSSLSFSNLKKVVEIQDKLNEQREKKIEQEKNDRENMKQNTNKNTNTNTNIKKICPADKILNTNTNRCIQICPIGQTRNKKNRCVNTSRKTKSKKSKK